MKTKLLIAVAVIVAALYVTAAAAQIPVNLAWDASPAAGVTNYSLYFSQNPAFTNNLAATGTGVINVGTNRTATATVAEGTRWFFCATAWAGGLQSTNPPSNVVSYIAPTAPSQPTNMRLTFVFAPGTTVTSTATNITIVFPAVP